MNVSCSHPYSILAATACGFSLGYLLASRQPPSQRSHRPHVSTDIVPSPTISSATGNEHDPISCAQQAGQPRTTPRVCIVTGGSRGIGAAVCERLAADGYKVVINYQGNKVRADELCSNICAKGGSAVTVQADVSDVAQVSRMFDEAERAFGAVTSCVNNAGILGPLTGLCDDATADQCAQVMATNLYGTFYVMREASKRMSTAKGGSGGAIVNVSAGSAYTGTPIAYAMSKGALNSLSAGSVAELARVGIRLNTVSPGPVHSDMMQNFSSADIAQMSSSIPMRRPGDPAEIAAAIAWLLSDDSSFVAGANLRVAGGKSLES